MIRKKKGFTLAELLVVVAIIAVLVTVSMPIFTSRLHKARVATDWANVRSYFSEIQADYVSTGEYNSNVPVDWHSNPSYDYYSITFLDGTKVKLKAGHCAVNFTKGTGYSIVYYCNNTGDAECELELGII